MQKGNCLIIKNDGIGDLILASGIIAGLSEIFDGGVDLITCAQNREIAENIYGIDRCFYVSRDSLQFQPLLRRLGILFPVLCLEDEDRHVLKHLRNTQYECVISLRRFIRQSSLILMKNTRAGRKYCAWQLPTNASFAAAERCSKGWTHYRGDLSVIPEGEYYEGFIGSVLGTTISYHPRLRCTDNLKSQVEPRNLGIGLSGASSRWPVEHWVDLIRQLQEGGYHIKLFGGKDELEYGASIEKECGECENFVGKLTLLDALPYLAKLSALICNDSGFAHFASLVVPKCVIILGGGTFGRFFPWPSAENQYVIYNALDCFDCDWQCKYPQKICLSHISPSKVLDYFNKIMGSGDVKRMYNLNPAEKCYNIAWRRLRGEKVGLEFKNYE